MYRTNSGHEGLWTACLAVARWVVVARAGDLNGVPALQRDLVLVLLGGPSEAGERPWPGALDDWLDADPVTVSFARFAWRALQVQCGRDRDAQKRHGGILERWTSRDVVDDRAEDRAHFLARLAALRDHPDLQGRDTPVLDLLLKGYNNRESAGALGLTDVQVHRAVERINDILRRLP